MAFTLAEAVVFFKGDDSGLEKSLDGAEKKTTSAAGNITKLLGGAIVGGATLAAGAIVGIGTKAFNVATQIDAATDQIGASLGLTEGQAKKFGDTIKRVYGNNFGDSIEDVGKGVENVAKTLRLTADDPALSKLTENAFRLRDVFGVEVTESVDAVKTLMDNFGISSEQAFDMLATGYQRGLDRSGDFLDTIGEYSVQFAEGGASAAQFFSALDTGLQGGMLGTDKAADAFKEFRVRILDGTDATAEAFDMLEGKIGINLADIQNGTVSVADAFGLVTQAISELEDPAAQMQAGVGLIGTQFEDLGAKVVTAMDLTEDWAEGGIKSISDMDTKYTSLGGAVEGMWRKFEVGIAPAGEAMLGFVNDNLPLIEGVISAVSDAVVGFVNGIPVAFAAAKKAWVEDLGGMRTAAENFMSLDVDFEIFWGRVNRAFNEGGESNEESWAEFLANSTNVFTSWVRLTLETLGTFFDNWRNTQDAWNALIEGDWSIFWSSLGANFEGVLNGFLNYIEFVFGPDIRDALANALQSMWNGAKDKMEELQEWWTSVWLPFRNLLPFSEPKDPRSPLRGLDKSGEALISNFQVGLDRGMSDLLGSFTGGLGQLGGGVSNTNYTIHVNAGGGGFEAGYSAGEGILEAMRYRGN